MKSDGALNKLPDELLEQVAGGMTDDQERTLKNTVAYLKQREYTLDDALGYFTAVNDPALRREIQDYLIANWDLL